jgi:hypothetical protein
MRLMQTYPNHRLRIFSNIETVTVTSAWAGVAVPD